MGASSQERYGSDADIESRKLYARVTEKLFGASKPVRIGRYKVLEELGRGAMGVVYKAVDEQLGRKLALKVLHPVSGGDAIGRARLLREAAALARLRHDNVVLVYDVGTHDPGTEREQVFLAMELVEGATLDVWLRSAVHDWRDVLAVFLQAGRALAAAHAAGVLHRDFKPQNVLVDTSGRARVLDFGLARALARASESDDNDPADSLSAPLTRTGSILGTPAYMAPEQLRGEQTDARADQFSFCVALYEGLYGERPFAGVPRFEAVRVTHVPKDSRIPDGLRRVILRGLSHDPARRFPDMAALLTAATPPAVRRRWLVAAAALVGCAGLGVAVWHFAGMSATIDTLGLELEQARQAALQPREPARPPPHPPASPAAPRLDVARLLGLVDSDPTTAALLLREVVAVPGVDLAALRRRVLTQPISRASIASPGATAVGFTDGGDVWLAGESGVRRFSCDGAPLAPDTAIEVAIADTIAAPATVFDARWPAPDDRSELRRDHAGRLFLGRQRLAEHDGPVTAVAWTRTGDRVAVASDAAVRVWDRRGHHLATLAGGAGSLSSLAWSPGGELLLAGGDDHHARVFRPGDAGPAAHRVLRGHTAPVIAIAWHPAGDRVATVAADGEARLWSLVPAARARLDHPAAVQALAWSVDDTHLASAGDDGQIHLFDPRRPAAPPTIFGDARSTLALAWTDDPPRLASAGGEARVRVWSATGEPLADLPTGARRGEDTLAVAWGPGGLIAASNTDRVLWWQDGAGEPRAVPGLRGPLLHIAFGPGGKEVATATVDGEAHRWHIDTGAGSPAAHTSARIGSNVYDLAWCGPDVALAREDRRVEVHHAGPTTTYRVHAPAHSVACDARGDVVAAGLANGQVLLWSRTKGTREPLHELRGHAAAVEAVAFSSAGDELATADARGRIYLWPHAEPRWTAALAAATTMCLTPAQRHDLLGEPLELAAKSAANCPVDPR